MFTALVYAEYTELVYVEYTELVYVEYTELLCVEYTVHWVSICGVYHAVSLSHTEDIKAELKKSSSSSK